MEIFKLFGRILIDNDHAMRQLDETDTRAQKVGRTFGGMITTAAKWGAGIVAAAGAAGGALLALANRTAQTSSALNDAAARAGTTVTVFQEMRYALTQVGVAESDVSLALQRLNQRVGEAEEGSSKYAKALERLGVATRNANGEIKTSDELFMELVTRLHEVEDSQLQAALAGQIFGVNLAQRLLPAIKAGGDAILELRNRAHQLGIVMEEENVQAAADFASMMDEIRLQLSSISQRVMLSVMPVLRNWLAWTIEHAPKVGAVFQFIGEVIEIVIRHTSRALQPFFDSVRNFLGTAWSFTIEIAGRAWDWIVGTTWEKKWRDITRWLTAVYTWTIGIAGAAWAWITGTTWADKMQDIKNWISSAWTWVVETAGAAWDWLDTRFPALTGAIKEVWDWLQRAWRWAIDIAGDAWEWLGERFPTLTDALETIWEWISRAWTWTLNLAGEAWEWLRNTAWPWLSETASTVWEWSLNLLGDLWIWLRETAWPWLSKTASTIWKWSVDLLGDAVQWVKDVAWPVILSGAKSAWSFTLNLLGDAWVWLRDVAWPVISQGVATAWNWTMDAAGSAWEWLTEGRWRETLDSIQAGFSELPGRISGYVSEAVQVVRHWFGDQLAAVSDRVVAIVLRIANFFQALKDGLIRRVTDAVNAVIGWFEDLRDRALGAVKALVDGVEEWFGETKIGKTFSWLGDQVRKVGDWFFNLYDRVVGHSYIPDMVEEIGEAIERLRERLANPVVRYTAEALQAFEGLSEGAVSAALAIAEGWDRALRSVGNTLSDWITQTTIALWDGTKTWVTIFSDFGSVTRSIMQSILGEITKQLVANIIAQNQWLAATLANISTAIAGFISQAYAALVAFFWWMGPAAPLAAAGVIAGVIAAVASYAGQAFRHLFGGGAPVPDISDVPDGGPGTGRPPSAGRQISEITGPTRDLLVDLLTPLASLNTLTGIGERIYQLLDERLPTPAMVLAGAGVAVGAGGISVTVAPGAVQVIAPAGSSTIVDRETLQEIAEQLAELIGFELRGMGRW